MSSTTYARLEICNHSDLVLLVAIGYEQPSSLTVTEGWWRLYPGYCKVPIDLALSKGRYFVHAESSPKSTMPGDAFKWGNQKELCIDTKDFKFERSVKCEKGEELAHFNVLSKDWNNTQKVDIFHTERRYDNLFRAKLAGLQRLLIIAGYNVGAVDGVAGEKTVNALNSLGLENSVFGFDFDRLFPLLEQ